MHQTCPFRYLKLKLYWKLSVQCLKRDPKVKPADPMKPAVVEGAVTAKLLVAPFAIFSATAAGLAVSHAGQHSASGIFINMQVEHLHEPSATANKFPQP